MSKKIVVELNRKSIQNAIKQLKSVKNIVQTQIMPEYMQRTADWIINRANEILDRSDIGENVKSAIFNAWDTEWTSDHSLVIRNYSRKAVYVEFGVGIIGQTSQHPNADATNYEYNVDSEAKFGQGYWQFSVRNDEELDIPQEAITYRQGQTIITQGTEGVWYLYNAVEDFKLREQERLWKELTRKYLG
jgi:hypothetical protein